MFAYDIDGDGDNDVITALNAHAYGLAWYEQVKDGDKITFKKHTVMTDKPEGNPYGVCFSQPHAMACVDIDGDGIKDIVTGKRYYAHNGRDPGAHDPAVIYWFRTTRNKTDPWNLRPISSTTTQVSAARSPQVTSTKTASLTSSSATKKVSSLLSSSKHSSAIMWISNIHMRIVFRKTHRIFNKNLIRNQAHHDQTLRSIPIQSRHHPRSNR